MSLSISFFVLLVMTAILQVPALAQPASCLHRILLLTVQDKDADGKNHELIGAFSSSYPEYKHAFAGLVVTAHERGGMRGYGTVSENDAATK
jgi:hypothetical protein